MKSGRLRRHDAAIHTDHLGSTSTLPIFDGAGYRKSSRLMGADWQVWQPFRR